MSRPPSGSTKKITQCSVNNAHNIVISRNVVYVCTCVQYSANVMLEIANEKSILTLIA